MFDIDNTITNLLPTLRLIEKVFALPEAYLEDVKSFRLSETYGLTREQELYFWNNSETELCRDSELAEERINEILEAYTDENTEIFIVTGRDEKYFNDTEEWLNRLNFKYDKLFCIGKMSKIKLIKELKADAVFEDNPIFFEEVLNDKIYEEVDVFCIDYPYNQTSYCTFRLDKTTGKQMQLIVGESNEKEL